MPHGDTDGMSGMNQHPSRSRTLRSFAGVALAATALIFAAGCGDDESSDSTAADTTAADTAADTTVSEQASDEIVFAGQWARTSPMMATMGAAYVTITSPIDDKLIAASVDATVAASVEVHETVVSGTDTTAAMGSDTTMPSGGMEMTMRPVEFIELPAGTAVELKPGGYHIMLLQLVEPLEVGDTLELTLVFETAGEITIDVPVLDEAP